MDVNIKYLVVGAVLSGVAGALIQHQYDNRDIEKAISEQKTVTQTKIVTVIKEVTRPDGTVEKETTTTDNSIKKEVEKHIEESIKARNKVWLVSLGASLDTSGKQQYKAEVQREVLGPIFVGIYGTTGREAGLSLGLNF